MHDTYPDVNTTAIHARYVRYIALRTPKFGIQRDTFGYIWIQSWIHMYRTRNSSPARSDRLRIDYFAFFATCLRSLLGLPPVDGPASSSASGSALFGASLRLRLFGSAAGAGATAGGSCAPRLLGVFDRWVFVRGGTGVLGTIKLYTAARPQQNS